MRVHVTGWAAGVLLALSAGCGGEPGSTNLADDSADAASGADGEADVPKVIDVDADTGATTDGSYPPVDAAAESPDTDACVASTAAHPHIAVGQQHGCAIRPDDTIVCWGAPTYDDGQAAAPPGQFKEISAGPLLSCAVAMDGHVECWGDEQASPPAGIFAHVVTGFDVGACALDACGHATCWSHPFLSQLVGPEPVVALAFGISFACGIRGDGTLRCSGKNDDGQSTPPSGVFTSVCAGDYHACALRADETVVCWGRGKPGDPRDEANVVFGQASPPSGQFVKLACGDAFSCAIRTDGTVVCWGAGEVDACGGPIENCGQSIPPAGTFTEIALGYTHACGLRTDGTIACWGSNTGDRSTPPSDFP